MKYIKLILLILLVFLSSSNAYSEYSDEEIEVKIDKINDLSLDELDIPLVSLFYLKQASPTSILLLYPLQHSGDIYKIQLLEKKGYVSIEYINSNSDNELDKHIRIMPTQYGLRMQAKIQ